MTLRHIIKAVAILAGSTALIACVSTGTKTTVTSGDDGQNINDVQQKAYNGPQARIAVSSFKDKSNNYGGWYNKQIGNGMADQLTTALVNSGRFIVLERQALDHIIGEQDLGASGRIKQETAAKIGEIEGAELLVVAAVTEFDANSAGAKASGGGWVSGVLGAVSGGMKKAHMAIDLRLIDAKTSRILAATSVEGESTDTNIGGAVLGWFGGGAAAGGFSSWKNTPKEKALRAVINKSVDYLLKKIPANYYRYGGSSPQNKASDSSQIKIAQSTLNCLGFNAGVADGLSGKGTRAAIAAYQKFKGLVANGELNMGTISSLKNESCKL